MTAAGPFTRGLSAVAWALNARASMLNHDLAEAAHLFVGSTHIALENAETSEFAREWIRRQLAESAARVTPLPGQIVDLPPRFGPIALSTRAPLSA